MLNDGLKCRVVIVGVRAIFLSSNLDSSYQAVQHNSSKFPLKVLSSVFSNIHKISNIMVSTKVVEEDLKATRAFRESNPHLFDVSDPDGITAWIYAIRVF